MGFKASAILVCPASLDGGPEKLLSDLGYANPAKVGETQLIDGIYPPRKTIWISAIGDCVIIASDFADGFFEDRPTDFTNALFRCFPNSEIAALILQSVVDLWGFAVFHGETLIRCKYGSSDEGVGRDQGTFLSIEEICRAKFRAGSGDIEMTDDEFGEIVVFEIFKEFTGLPLDEDEALNTLGMCFALGTPPKNPWWKIWKR